MTQVLTGQQNLQDLWREVIIDDGNGQPAVLTTTTLPAPSLLVVGAFESTFANDIVLTPTETTFTLNPFTDEVLVTVSEDVQMLIQDYTATVSDLVYHEEAVTVVRVVPAPVPPVFDAVTVTESLTMEGPTSTNAIFEALATSENVSVYPGGYNPQIISEPVSSASESVTVQGPVSPALATESSVTSESVTVTVV